MMPHVKRADHRGHHPVHVTLRSKFRPLRSQFVFPTVRGAIRDISRRRGEHFRVVHFSVQYDHVHLIVEATDRRALLSGVRGLSISIARRVNRLVFRRGRVIADRWHGRDLETPRAVRRALIYVLGNARKHGKVACPEIDPFSSGPYFNGYWELDGALPIERSPGLVPGCLGPAAEVPVAAAKTWLLETGWRRLGSISIQESPRGPQT